MSAGAPFLTLFTWNYCTDRLPSLTIWTGPHCKAGSSRFVSTHLGERQSNESWQWIGAVLAAVAGVVYVGGRMGLKSLVRGRVIETQPVPVEGSVKVAL